MSGPVATVLLPYLLFERDVSFIESIVNTVSEHDLDQPPTLNAFLVHDMRPVGGRYHGDGRPFALERGLQPEWEPRDLEQIASAFGHTPVDELVVIAFSNGNEDHRVLGELVLLLAERFAGVVAFGGALWPPLPTGWSISVGDADWRDIEPFFREMIASMPGKVIGLRYEPRPGREWTSHVADTSFVRAWLEHPRFRMVK